MPAAIFPRTELYPPSAPQTIHGHSAEAEAAIASRHFTWLQQAGLLVVGHSITADSSVASRFRGQEFRRIRVEAAHIPDSAPIFNLSRDKKPSTVAIKEDVLDPIEDYFRRCMSQGQKYALSGLANYFNYTRHPEGKINLNTVDPSLSSDIAEQQRNFSYLRTHLLSQVATPSTVI